MSENKFNFTEKTFTFLRGLEENNTKSWFESNRSDYDDYLLQPFRCLAENLQETIRSIDPQLETTPAVNKTISRIHRDIRFSKDKRPYRTSMWLGFKIYAAEGWQSHPAIFFEIMPNAYRYGMGFYLTGTVTMETMRYEILKNDHRFNTVLAWYQSQKEFSLEGDLYKRLKDIPGDDVRAFWYMRKNIYLVHNSAICSELFTSDLSQRLSAGFRALQPAYDYFKHISEQEKMELKPLL